MESSHPKRRERLPTLLLGVFLGGVILYTAMMPLQLSLAAAAHHGDNENLRRTSKMGDEFYPRRRDPGWHTIHVFYGDEKGLGAPPNQQWFAQIQQDQVVVDLLGTNGYFIDLAANDAKELSNTLGLERQGWNGTWNK